MAQKTISAEIEARREQLAQQRRAWDDLRHQIEIAEAELRGLELAASLMPPWLSQVGPEKEGTENKPEAHAGGKGRQPGAISQPWRGILKLMIDMYPDGADRGQIAALGPQVGLKNLDPRQVTPRMNSYISLGYIIENNGKYAVTGAAKERFGFSLSPRANADDELPLEPDERMAAE